MKQRRLRLQTTAYLLAFCMVAGALFACLRLDVAAQGASVPSEEIAETIRAVEELERATRTYYKTADTFAYAVRYIRSGRYADVRWQTLVGAIDASYERAMSAHASLRSIDSLTVAKERYGSPYRVDFVHLAAVADAKRDFAGWAGDLITLAAEIDSLYEAREMTANDAGVFGAQDLRADIDALNLCAIAEEQRVGFANAMRRYYLEGGYDRAVTVFLLRETGLPEESLTVQTICDALWVRLDASTCPQETLALENLYGVTGSERLEYACLALAEWLYREYCEENSRHELQVMFVCPPLCTGDGCVYWKCKHCNKVVTQAVSAAVSHRYAVTRTEPTETEPGTVQKICALCGFCKTECYDHLQAGDVDLDGRVTARDYMYIKCGALGACEMTKRRQYLADLNRDGAVDAKDYLLLRGMLLRGELT